MSSPPSGSDSDKTSGAFARFHPGVQRWIWKQGGWTELHDIQERAARPILDAEHDVLLSAPTAGGKTEAAFFPIVSRLAEADRIGAGCVCISPLKALINDQYRRLKELGEAANVQVTRWHGDVPSSHKKAFIRDPTGILLITPESLEAHCVRRGSSMASLYSALQYIVVDELHAFIGTERGKQLQSLMHRLEYVARRRIPRVGLSATLGDMGLAGEFMRPSGGGDVVHIEGDGVGREIKISLRGYRKKPPREAPSDSEDSEVDENASKVGDLHDIAAHLYSKLRGTDNLIFANSRSRVEALTDMLRRRCEAERVPQEFFAHHGSLARDIREHAERRLKEKSRPSNVVATTTLEMGIDIGSMKSIAQVGIPPSVASMRQRLGRSGRRGSDAAIMRVYITESDRVSDSSPQDALRAQIMQAMAMVELMVEGKTEPPDDRRLHLSTLVQQLLSTIAQHGGLRANEAWGLLCKVGPFALSDGSKFADLLRELGRRELITQLGDGLLVLGVVGERIVDHYEFFAAFWTAPEFRIVHAGRELGSIPITAPMAAGSFLVFAGRRWEVIGVDPGPRVITVRPAKGGRPPQFDGGPLPVDDLVRKRMLEVYRDDNLPPYLDRAAKELVTEGRRYFRTAGLDRKRFIGTEGTTYLFPWRGDRVMATLVALLGGWKLTASNEGIAVRVLASLSSVRRVIHQILAAPPPAPDRLAAATRNLIEEKYDEYLPVALLREDYATRHFDVPGALESLRRMIKDMGE